MNAAGPGLRVGTAGHAFRKVVAAAAVAGEPPFRGVLFRSATTARLAR